MPTAEILTIGTEILLGEIVDTNSRHIARSLRDSGVDLFYTGSVGDNPARIATFIQQAMQRTEIIITTGGLGPTVDDPTREAVAAAFGVETEFREELWQQVEQRFERFGRKPTENNKRQAYVPIGAIGVENPVGTAPAFIMESEKNAVICLPGVPREMEHLLEYNVIPYLRKRWNLKGLIKARVLHTAGVGESQIDEIIGDLEEMHNPTVGLAAHAGQVDVRITAKAESEDEANALIATVEVELRERLGDWVYGVDGETLESKALDHMASAGWKLVVVESGVGGSLTARLADQGEQFLGGQVLADKPELEELTNACRQYLASAGADVCVGLTLISGKEKQDLHLVILSPVKENAITRSYGGPPQMAGLWAVNMCLDLIRRLKTE